MNAQQAENLRILIRHMETKCNRTLDMGMYGTCETPACALGEAAVCPGLAHLGLPPPGMISMTDHGWHFGEDFSERLPLFGTASRNAWGRNRVTPQEWAAEARKVLAKHGYSMDDGFQSFMAKVLDPKPIDTTQPPMVFRSFRKAIGL